MNLFYSPIAQADTLAARVTKTSSALAEASFRLAAQGQLGPINSPGLREWAQYVQDLEADFKSSLKHLSNHKKKERPYVQRE